MAQNVFILSAEEYSMVQGMAKRIEQLEDLNRLHETMLAQAREEIANNRQRRKDMAAKIAEQREVIASDNKALAAKTHELLCKEAELANLSSALREAKRDCEGTAQELKAARAERDAEKVFRQDVQEELSRCQQTSRKRLEYMEHLQKAVLDLKHEQVCIATNPRTGTVKVVSVVKADTYRKFGWTVSEVGLVDRPA